MPAVEKVGRRPTVEMVNQRPDVEKDNKPEVIVDTSYPPLNPQEFIDQLLDMSTNAGNLQQAANFDKILGPNGILGIFSKLGKSREEHRQSRLQPQSSKQIKAA